MARHGYFAPTASAAKAEGEVGKIDDEVLKTDALDALPADVAAQPGRLASGGTGFQVSLHVDLNSLAFEKRQGRHFDKLNMITVLFNGAGNYVAGEMGVVDMALKNSTLAELSKRGLNATMVLDAPEGSYHLRVVIEDAASGKLFASTRPVTMP